MKSSKPSLKRIDTEGRDVTDLPGLWSEEDREVDMRLKWVDSSERMPIEHTADQNFVIWHVRPSDGLTTILVLSRRDIVPGDKWLDTGADELYRLREENAALKSALKCGRKYMRNHFNMTMTGFSRALEVTPTQLSAWTSDPITTPPQFVD